MKIVLHSKPKLLWIAVKLFDKAAAKVTYLEMIKNLAIDYEVFFLTGWRDKPVQIAVGPHPIRYFSQLGSGLMQKMTRRLFLAFSIRRNVISICPDLIVINCNDSPNALKVLAKLRKKMGFKVIMDVRTLPTEKEDIRGFGNLARGLCFSARNLDGISYITEELRYYCMVKFELPPHKFTTWSSGVDPELFCYPETVPQLPFKLVYHGGILAACRGIDQLIFALDLVRDLNIQLVLISSLREKRTIDLIDQLNLTDRVVLLPPLPHSKIPEEIAKCHAGILPFPENDAWKTSSPLKLFEYLACGKPVIVTDIPAHRNVLKNSRFTFYSKNSEPEALADAIKRAFFALDAFKNFGFEARDLALKDYTWAQQAAKLSRFLKTL